MYTYILSSSPTFTLTSAHHKLIHKHSLSHHNAFSFFTTHIQCQHLPQNGKLFFFFQPLVPPSGTISLSLCNMFKLCLASSHSLRLIFSLSLTPNTSNCLQPASSKSLCVCMQGMLHAPVSIYEWGRGGGGRGGMDEV